MHCSLSRYLEKICYWAGSHTIINRPLSSFEDSLSPLTRGDSLSSYNRLFELSIALVLTMSRLIVIALVAHFVPVALGVRVCYTHVAEQTVRMIYSSHGSYPRRDSWRPSHLLGHQAGFRCTCLTQAIYLMCWASENLKPVASCRRGWRCSKPVYERWRGRWRPRRFCWIESVSNPATKTVRQ